jgi:DhnA family fructose-bisphosphate aldolase class Ia
MNLKTQDVPADVPKNKIEEYKKNWQLATRNSGNLMLFAGDQKVEHLNNDFFGKNINPEDNSPEHLFKIASKAEIGVFATQLGLISMYGKKYPNIPYLVKINSKTNLTPGNNPLSLAWYDIADVVNFKKQSGLNILGIGYTIYIGSKNEVQMLKEISKIVYEAHNNGLLAIIWVYPRGEKIKNEDDIHLIAGGAGVAHCLGADFVKVKYPYNSKIKNIPEKYKEVIKAAGKTSVLCAGGSAKNSKSFLKDIHKQITISGSKGIAIGRNIHQKSTTEAINFIKAVSAIVIHGKTLEQALKILEK